MRCAARHYALLAYLPLWPVSFAGRELLSLDGEAAELESVQRHASL